VRGFLQRIYGLDDVNIVIEQPPKIEFGEYALPIGFELARKLRKAPRKIAEEIVAGISAVSGFDKFEIAGAGYINVRINRAEVAAALFADQQAKDEVPPGKSWWNIPASTPTRLHISDIFATRSWAIRSVACCATRAGEVDVQNYIDNTGVPSGRCGRQFLHIEKDTRRN
jgi:arginyl-tRNA synthetase